MSVFAGASEIISTGLGTVTITGESSGDDSSEGVQLDNGALISSESSKITLTGTSNATGDGNEGIEIKGSSKIESTGTGATAATISLTGTGAAGEDENHGVFVSEEASISAIDGSIVIEGDSLGTGDINVGVLLEDESEVFSTGLGTVSITGTGAAGEDENHGVWVIDGSVSVVDGNIVIIGDTLGTGNHNVGVRLEDGSEVISTGLGTVSITGTGSGLS